MKALAAALAGLALAGCAHGPAPADPVERAAGWLQGRFDNAAQARADPRFHAVTVRWHPIWRDRVDGRWFLVEQARAATPDAPYRRRVHRLRADGEAVVADVFGLPADDPADVASLRPADLVAQPGCAVRLRAVRGGFRGATSGRACPSRFRGAAYATAEVLLDARGFASRDRGFDADGRAVWGPEHGPYVFRRVSGH